MQFVSKNDWSCTFSENYKPYQIHGTNYTFLIEKCNSYPRLVASCVFLEKSSTHQNMVRDADFMQSKEYAKNQTKYGNKKIC